MEEGLHVASAEQALRPSRRQQQQSQTEVTPAHWEDEDYRQLQTPYAQNLVL